MTAMFHRISKANQSVALFRIARNLASVSNHVRRKCPGTLLQARSILTRVECDSGFNEMASGTKRKLYLLGGKGGVGKTSCAASLAVKFANQGHPTIVVSTDPAHSLSDSFAQNLTGGILKPVEGVDSPLLALEISLERTKGELHSHFKKEDSGVKSLMESMGLGMLAGEIVESEECDKFSRIVLDTAPTGHTLRLLSLPDFMEASIGKITKLKKKFAAAASALRSVLGSKDPTQDAPSELDQVRERMAKVRDLFRNADTTEFIIVTIPTVMAINESSRLYASLKRENVPVRSLIVNQLLPPSASDCRFCSLRRKEQTRVLDMIHSDRGLSTLRLIQAPLLDAEIRGIPALKYMADAVWR